MNQRAAETEKPRLLLVGSGPTEIGRQPVNRHGKPDLSGAVLPHLLDNLLDYLRGHPSDRSSSSAFRRYEVAAVRKFDSLQTIPVLGGPSVVRGADEKKVRMALFLAEQRGLDGVVILIDRESKTQPDRAKRLRQGREQYRKAHIGKGEEVACAVGAACRSVETWLLADPHARQKVFGSNTPNPFSGDPEDRPPPGQLKKHIAGQAQRAGKDPHEAYEELAKAARPDELRRRCKTSYPPFADDVATEILPLC